MVMRFVSANCLWRTTAAGSHAHTDLPHTVYAHNAEVPPHYTLYKTLQQSVMLLLSENQGSRFPISRS